MEHVLHCVAEGFGVHEETEVVNPPILTAFARTPRVLQNVRHILCGGFFFFVKIHEFFRSSGHT